MCETMNHPMGPANDAEAEQALRIIGRAIERARAKREATGTEPVTDDPVALGVLDTMDYLTDRLREKRAAEALAEAPPELRQALKEWQGHVEVTIRGQLESEAGK